MVREKILINAHWKFIHGDILAAKKSNYDVSDWYDVGIPHSFAYPYYQSNDFYVGYGCYRKNIYIKKEWFGNQISLEFQGAFQHAEVFLNGVFVGEHKGGYTAFLINISDVVVEGKNLLFIRLNNVWNGQIAPRAGEHVFNGGIYRDVSIIVTKSIHVDWLGTFVTTPKVTKEEAELSIKTDVVNNYSTDILCNLVSKIFFMGNEVAQIESKQNIRAYKEAHFEQKISILKPNLWHPETPNLYTMHTYVYANNILYDDYITNFGIRWFSFTKDKGFFLNGEHYNIWGANVHQDHGGWSDAVTHEGIYRDIKMIKDCGMNFIRGSHYPHHRIFAEECDKQGIIFWSELCYWGNGGVPMDGYWTASAYPIREEDEAGFEENCVKTLEEMIKVNRNSPSIIVWSMCNEIFLAHPDVMNKVKLLLKKLVKRSHELDSTRPAAIGGAQRGGFDILGDLAGYNGDGASIFINPNIPNFVSEYGSAVSDRPGKYDWRFKYGVEQDYAWRSGKSLWCAFHHGSIMRNMGHMGIIDYYRLPLLEWH